MAHSAEYYAKLSDEEMAAADNSTTLEERIAHLESAFRFAQAACAQRKKETNVFLLNPSRGKHD